VKKSSEFGKTAEKKEKKRKKDKYSTGDAAH